jgi:hypothetical protein
VVLALFRGDPLATPQRGCFHGAVHRGLGLLVLGAALFLSATGRAQDVDDAARAAARKLGYAGIEAYQANEYKSALEKLDKAYRVLQAPSLGLWSARALLANGRLVEASERYLEVTRLSPSGGEKAVQEQAKTDARRELEGLTPRIPSLVIRLEGAYASDVKLMVDGMPVSSALVGEGRPTNPGKHRVEGVRGTERVQAEVVLQEREEKSVTLRFNPAALLGGGGDGASDPPAGGSTGTATAPSPAGDSGAGRPAPGSGKGSAVRTMGWVAIGIGAAGGGVGITTSVLTYQKKKDIEAAGDCIGVCKNTGRVQNFNTLRTIAIASSVGAGVLIITGVALLVAAPSDSPEVALELGPTSIGLRGTF